MSQVLPVACGVAKILFGIVLLMEMSSLSSIWNIKSVAKVLRLNRLGTKLQGGKGGKPFNLSYFRIFLKEESFNPSSWIEKYLTSLSCRCSTSARSTSWWWESSASAWTQPSSSSTGKIRRCQYWYCWFHVLDYVISFDLLIMWTVHVRALCKYC